MEMCRCTHSQRLVSPRPPCQVCIKWETGFSLETFPVLVHGCFPTGLSKVGLHSPPPGTTSRRQLPAVGTGYCKPLSQGCSATKQIPSIPASDADSLQGIPVLWAVLESQKKQGTAKGWFPWVRARKHLKIKYSRTISLWEDHLLVHRRPSVWVLGSPSRHFHLASPCLCSLESSQLSHVTFLEVSK